MGAKFFSQRTPGRTRDAVSQARASDPGLEGLDHQQAQVLGALRRAAGAPVSYAELREAGVELPASVVSELELAGVGIERCFGAGRGGVGVRLDPANDPAVRSTPDPEEGQAPTDAETETAWSTVRTFGDRASGLDRTPFRGNPRSRALALIALLASIAVAASLAAMWATGGDHRTPVPIAKRPQSRPAVAAAGRHRAKAPRPAHRLPPVPVSPALATELEAQGHSLLEADRYGEAVPVLERAVGATGETLGGCLEPVSSTCLTYAYALYDLGRAVRLNGDPQAAVPILERRLQIDNQRSVVGVELQLARQGIG